MADQSLTKFNCQLDMRSIRLSREKHGRGFVTGDAGERATRVDEGSLIFGIKENLNTMPDARSMMNQQKPLLPARSNTAGIGEPTWSEAQFIDHIIVLGIAVDIGDETVDREPNAPRPMFAAISSGAFRLTNFSANAIRPFHPVMWTPRASTTNPTGRAVAVRGHSNNVPYLSIQEYDPAVHAFSREVLEDHRTRFDAKINREDDPEHKGRKRFVTAFDEAFWQYCVAGAANSIMETIVMLGADRSRSTPKEAFAYARRQAISGDPVFTALFNKLAIVVSSEDSVEHKVHAAYIGPKNGMDYVTEKNSADPVRKNEKFVPSPLLEELNSPWHIQVNGPILSAQAVRRFDEYFTSRIIGYFPHGCDPGLTQTFIMKRPSQ